MSGSIHRPGLVKHSAFYFLAVLGLNAGAWAAPGLRVDQAARIAQGELSERGLTDRIYVTSLAIESQSISQGEKYWYARWSQPLALDDTKRELGLRINMDGSLVRVVENASGDGGSAGREALRDHRRRSDRPSILDLKH